MLNLCIKSHILQEEYHITMLAAAIVWYQVKKFEFSNLDIDDICNIFNLKKGNVITYYKLIPMQ